MRFGGGMSPGGAAQFSLPSGFGHGSSGNPGMNFPAHNFPVPGHVGSTPYSNYKHNLPATPNGLHQSWNGNWTGPWNGYHHHDHHYPGYYGYGPWFSLGWGGGWYNDYYPYLYPYPNDDYPYTYFYAPEAAARVTAAYPPAAAIEEVPAPAAQNESAASAEGDTPDAMQFYDQGRSAFLAGDYRLALRMANHAAVESPQNAQVHELISLALFALGDYRGAASEAHAAMAFGPIGNWDSLYAYYNNADTYTKQLRTLEKAAADNPASAPARFLLGYHYLMTGAKDHAKAEFARAVALTPNDKLAQHYLKQLQGAGPISPPTMPAMPAKPQGQSL